METYNRLRWLAGFSLAAALAFRAFTLSYPASSDFEVYWYAAHAWNSGLSPYLQYSHSWPGSIFKYPPYLLPLFLPFFYLPIHIAKAIWAGLGIFAVFFAIFWCKKRCFSTRIPWIVGLSFWWIWLSHIYFGQITLLILLAALLVSENPIRNPLKESFLWSFLAYLLSAKVFSLFSMGGTPKSLLTRVALTKLCTCTLSLFLFAHLVLVATSPHRMDALSDQFNQHIRLYHEWWTAASSGGTDLGADIIRGPQNHSWTAALLRSFQVDTHSACWDSLIPLLLGLILSSSWHFLSKNLRFVERWSGWLALGVMIHPLAWHHSFVMTYPLAVFSLDRSLQSENRKWIFVSGLGIACIALFIPQVIGVSLVVPLESVGSKSWGVLLLAMSLVFSQRPRKKS